MKNQSVAVIGANGKTGSRVLARLQAAGFAFAHPTLRPALTDLLGGRSTAS